MKKLLTIILILLFSVAAFGAQKIVDLPLTSDLVDSKSNLTAGALSRVSAATYIDTDSVLQTAWGDRAQSIHTSAQNDITQAWWTRARQANSTANELIADAGDATHPISRASNIVTAGNSYVLSVYAKAGAVGWILLQATGDGENDYAYVNLSDGAIGGSDNVVFDSNSEGDGWYRLAIVFSRSANGDIFIYPCEDDGDFTFAGDGSTVSIELKQIMLETLPSGNVIGDTLYDQNGGAGGSGDKGAFTYADLLGAETITAQNDRDFSSGNIGNWTIVADGAGTCAYSPADLDGADDKQGLITSNGDAYAYAALTVSASGGGGAAILTPNTLYKVSARVHVPAANTLKTALMSWSDITGEIPLSVSLALGNDTYTTIEEYFYLAADVVGSILIGFDGNPDDGDKMYFDDISIKPIDITWVPYGTNKIKIDDAVGTGGALHITYVDNGLGVRQYLRDSYDLISDLTVGESYLFQFDAKVGAGDSASLKIYDGSDFISSGNIAESFTTYKMIFTAHGATNCYIVFAGMGVGEEVWIDNLTIKSVPDLALLEPSDYVNSASIAAKARFETNGLLVEGEATNLLDYSEDWSQWTDYNLTETYDTVADPRGDTNTSCGFIADATKSEQRFQGYAVSSILVYNTVYTFSAFGKAGTVGWMQLLVITKDNNTSSAYFDLSGSGAVGTEDTLVDSGIELVGNGWYRAWIAVDIKTGTTAPNARVYPASADGTNSFAATINDVLIYAYGAQLEETPYPTSYIYTDSCSVTRTSEAADGTYGFQWTISAALQTILANNGTVIFEWTPAFAAADGSGTGTGIVTFEPSATGLIYYDFDNTDFEITDSTNTVINNESIASGTIYIIAGRWHKANDDLNISEKHDGTWTHGTAGAFDDSIPHTGDDLWLHYGSEYPAHIKNLMIFDYYLSDSALDAALLEGGGMNSMQLGLEMQ